MNIRKLFLTAGLIAAFTIPLVATSLYAATAVNTYTVNSTADKTDANPGNNVCETAAGNGECTLRAAVMESNAHIGTDRISIKPGTYNLSIGGTDGDTPNAAKGDLDITDDVTLAGSGRGLTFLDGQAKDRVFDLDYGTRVEIESMTVRNGKVTAGGGSAIRARGYQANFIYLIVENNNGAEAIYNDTGEMSFYRLEVRFNNAGYNGAGGVSSKGVLRINQSAIRNNHGFGGGGLFLLNSTLIVNSTIANNFAEHRGGGIEFGNADLPILLDLSNVTITGNHAHMDDTLSSGGGGGVASWDDDDIVKVRNSIIAQNIDENFDKPDGYAPEKAHDCLGTFISDGYNLIGDNWNCVGFTNGSNGDKVGTHASPLNAKFGTLAASGSSASIVPLLTGSPAIDAGNFNGCKDRDGNVLVVDGRGFARPIEGDNKPGLWCDMGAFEYGSTKSPTPTPTVQSCNAKPAASNLDTPSNGSEITQTKVHLNWDGPVCANKYKVIVRQDTKKGPKVDRKTLQTTEYQTKKLAKHHTYYWVVKTCNSFGCTRSPWFTFKIK